MRPILGAPAATFSAADLATIFRSEEIRKLDERKEALFREVLREHFPTMDGAVELIDALAADGFLMAVGSSGPPENIALCLEKLGRRREVRCGRDGADVTRGKPDPQVFRAGREPARRCRPTRVRSSKMRCMASKRPTARAC